MCILYNIAFLVFLFFYAPIFLLKKRRHGIFLRLGLYPKGLIERLSERKNIWVHAVSVGEVIAVSALVKAIRQRHPEFRIVFTTVTETGNAAAKNILPDSDIILYLPFDISFIIRKVISYIRPCFIVITETEIWPNLIMCLYESNIKIFLANGRISDSSFKRYRIIKPFLAGLLKKISLCCMQTRESSSRILQLGARQSGTVVSGNMKFDSAFLDNISEKDKDSLRHALGIDHAGQLMVAGSTHKGEEAIILRTYKRLKDKFPGVRLVVAPRHIDRAAETAKTAQALGIKTARFSDIGEGSNAISIESVLILDKIGSLKKLYSIAEIVFVGGSMVKKGGQNMIEPAVFGKPIIMGPYTNNFRDIIDMFLKEDAIMVADSEERLFGMCNMLLQDADSRERLGERARSIVARNKGSAQRTLDLIENENVFL
jgi:3-deoxy-D-manno-octulosonic-acid transferase